MGSGGAYFWIKKVQKSIFRAPKNHFLMIKNFSIFSKIFKKFKKFQKFSKNFKKLKINFIFNTYNLYYRKSWKFTFFKSEKT